MLAEVAEVELLAGASSSWVALRDEDLPAVACRADPGGAMDVQPDVPALRARRLARVDADPNAQRRGGGPDVRGERPLGADRGLCGVAGARECDEELVAAAVDLMAAVPGDRLAHEPAMVGHDRRVLVAELLHEARRVLDVGEEEGDDPGREACSPVDPKTRRERRLVTPAPAARRRSGRSQPCGAPEDGASRSGGGRQRGARRRRGAEVVGASISKRSPVRASLTATRPGCPRYQRSVTSRPSPARWASSRICWVSMVGILVCSLSGTFR